MKTHDSILFGRNTGGKTKRRVVFVYEASIPSLDLSRIRQRKGPLTSWSPNEATRLELASENCHA